MYYIEYLECGGSDMTELEKRRLVKDILAKDELYMLLSFRAANYLKGESFPFVGQWDAKSKFLVVFTSYEQAKKYIDDSIYEKPSGMYMLARLEKDADKNLITILTEAIAVGIQHLEVDPSEEKALGCTIEWFFEAADIRIPAQETGGSQAEKRLSLLPIWQFQNPYLVSPERAQIIINQVFQSGGTVEEFKTRFLTSQTLAENCFVADCLNSKLIPQARNNNRMDDIEYFRRVNVVLEHVVWSRLDEEAELYVYLDPATDKLFVNREAMYVLYTDLYKHQSRFKYRRVEGKQEIIDLMQQNQVQKIIVTDGLTNMIVLGGTAPIQE